MKWLRQWLSSDDREEAVSRIEEEAATLIDAGSYQSRFLHIAENNFFGLFSTSPDGRFTIAWRDGNDERTIGGYRTEGEGLCLLLENGAVLASSRAERPNDGKVANNGTFIVNDWLFGDGLNGRLRAFDDHGTLILDHFFTANLHNNGLSADGRYAVCQTANNPDSEDGDLMALFDLEECRLLARWHPEPGWAERYEFDGNRRELICHYRDGEVVRFAFNGTMVDRDSWLARRIARGDLIVIGAMIRAADERWRDDPAQLIAGLDAAVAQRDVFLDRPRAMRLKGELMEMLQRPEDALKAYDEALLLDPQIGVSRRAEALRKALYPEEAKVNARLSRFERNARKLGIEHEVVPLEAGELKLWRCGADAPWACVEEAALAHYEQEGWTGVAAEGGLILTLIKAASFEKLPVRSADTFIEALYAQNVAFTEDRFDPLELVANVATATLQRIARNWRVIAASAGDTPAFYPRVRWPHVEGLFTALGPARLAEIAEIFASASYDYRAGWPDLTLWRGGDIRFVEVKSPSDQLHASQSRLIGSILVPLKFRTGIAEIRKAN